jgi:hypothetical protein
MLENKGGLCASGGPFSAHPIGRLQTLPANIKLGLNLGYEQTVLATKKKKMFYNIDTYRSKRL